MFFTLCFVASVPSLVLVLLRPEDADRTRRRRPAEMRDAAAAILRVRARRRRAVDVGVDARVAPSGWRTLGDVVAFDYPYMRAGRKAPDRLPVLIDAHRAVLAKAQARAKGPVFLIGKSMGGRVGCHLALEEPVAGVICLGYPLQSGATGAMRDEVLLALRTPILFVQGSRDALCPSTSWPPCARA